MLRLKFATRRTAALIFIIAFLVYEFPLLYDLFYKPFFNWSPAQDIVSASLIPVSVLTQGDFYLDEYRDWIFGVFRDPYFVAQVNQHFVSRYPIAAGVLAIPFYGLPLGTGWLAHPDKAWLSFPISAFFPAKFASALISALAVLMFFFCARELTNLRTSAGLALAFLFGTSVWSTASQGLWQQTPSLLFQTIGIWFLLRGKRKGAASVAPGALFFSAATIARQNDALAAIGFTILVLIQYRSALLGWIVWALPPAFLAIWYNTIYNGAPFVFGYQDGVGQYFSFPKVEALLGLLISPSRGLFVYSPFLILGIIGVWYARLERERLFYWSAALVALLMYVMLSMWNDWMGGWGYGTRMLTDLLPYISLLMIPVVTRLDRWGNLAFAVSVAYSGFVHSLGLWDYGGAWHWSWPEQRFNVWSISQNEIFFYIRHYFDLGLSFLSRFKR